MSDRTIASLIASLLPHREIIAQWQGQGGDALSARRAALAQVTAFARIIDDDAGWEMIAGKRHEDSWLTFDWPDGFDELLLCAPLCQLVSFQCAQCVIGRRQQDYSCAHPDTVFGRVGALIMLRQRAALQEHLLLIREMLTSEKELLWDLATHSIINDEEGRKAEGGGRGQE
jgi:hypothetical protein